MSLYEYVSSVPTGHTDFMGFYGSDVHYYMTYYLGWVCGLGDVPGGRRYDWDIGVDLAIAWADQYTDVASETEPWRSVESRKKWHFRTSTGDEIIRNEHNKRQWLKYKRVNDIRTQTVADSTQARNPLEMALKPDEPDLLAVGAALHAWQDSFAHSGHEDLAAHATGGHRVDEPYGAKYEETGYKNARDAGRNITKTMEMAKKTYEILGRVRQKYCEKGCKKPWARVARAIRKQFKAASAKDHNKRAESWAKWVSAQVGWKTDYWSGGDDDEWHDAFVSATRQLMRDMEE